MRKITTWLLVRLEAWFGWLWAPGTGRGYSSPPRLKPDRPKEVTHVLIGSYWAAREWCRNRGHLHLFHGAWPPNVLFVSISMPYALRDFSGPIEVHWLAGSSTFGEAALNEIEMSIKAIQAVHPAKTHPRPLDY